MATASLARTEPVRLFISYAREERARVKRLADALTAAGYSVWWDAALEGGHHFAAEITRELEAADAVIVVWTPQATTSNWVLDEAMVGRDRGCLIPLSVDDTRPPLGFRQIQAIPLMDHAEGDIVPAISRAAARILDLPPPPLPEKRPPGVKDMLKGWNNDRLDTSGYPLWWPFAWVACGLLVAFFWKYF